MRQNHKYIGWAPKRILWRFGRVPKRIFLRLGSLQFIAKCGPGNPPSAGIRHRTKSKTCPEHSRRIEIRKPVLSAAEGSKFLCALVLLASSSALWARPSADPASAGSDLVRLRRIGGPKSIFSPLVCLWLTESATGGFSSSVGHRFHEIAYEVVPPKGSACGGAITLLAAARKLDPPAKYVLPDMINLISRSAAGPPKGGKGGVYQLLVDYVDESADLEVLRGGISYLLEGLDSREQREELLEKMLKNLGSKNKRLDSELATELGLLAAEKADANAAKAYFIQAYNNNKYNKLAFAKLSDVAPERVGPAMYLEHLRLVLDENPLALESALAFAQYAEKLHLYETAAGGYEYCADLFRYLHSAAGGQNAKYGVLGTHPSAALPASLYLPWAISSYNTQRSRHKCLQIASDVRQSGNFDLLLEAITGKAATKIGNQQQSNQILKAAGDKAEKLLMAAPKHDKAQKLFMGPPKGGKGPPKGRSVSAEQLAWFYCFAAPDANKALQWANKAYSDESYSATKASILAYSLVMNGQTDLAQLLIDNYRRNQIADLTLAQIQLAQEQQDSAIENLKSAIARDPGSLAAERAKQILDQQGGQYIPPIDTGIVLAELGNRLRRAIVPEFVSPEKIISFQLKLPGSKFSYGSKFEGAIAIRNNSAQPLVISDGGLLKGNIRIDAKVSGDIDEKIPNLVSF